MNRRSGEILLVKGKTLDASDVALMNRFLVDSVVVTVPTAEGEAGEPKTVTFGVEDVAAEYTLPVFGKIPLDPAFAEKADEGKFYETENPYLQTAVRALSAMSRIM